jgi:hypothetical protein
MRQRSGKAHAALTRGMVGNPAGTKDHDHDTLTALHCNDPGADRVRQRTNSNV